MNKNNVEFKKTSLLIGAILLIFTILYFSLYSIVYMAFSTAVDILIPQRDIAKIIIELISGVMYCFMFVLPGIIFIPFSRAITREKPIKETPRLSFGNAIPIVLASIGIITSAAYINSLIGSAFGASGLLSEPASMTFVDFLISIVTLAIVPAFSEEFLFRRTILRALAPYGKIFAIIASGVMFGLMHQNVLQIFYATIAGIIIGYAYVKTNSFLCVFLIHFFNNFISALQQYLFVILDDLTANIVVGILSALISLLGLISLIILINIEKNKTSVCDTGSFGKIYPSSILYVRKPLTVNSAKAFFLQPTVIIFTIISCVIAITYLFV